MTDKLKIIICDNIINEAKAIVASENHDDVIISSHIPVCLLPSEKSQTAYNKYLQKDLNTVYMTPCFINLMPDESKADLQDNSMCLTLIAGKKYIEHLISEGSYILSPGWLKNWRNYLKSWGFDQATAQRFFNECAGKLTLLDTGVIPDSADTLKEMGEYLDLPVQLIPVGLDHFRLMFNNVVQTWRLTKVSKKYSDENKLVNRKLADYAMSINLMSKLASRRNETDTINAIFEIFTMLFGADKVYYVQFKEDVVSDILSNHSDGIDENEILNWIASMVDNDYVIKEKGFAVRVKNDNHIAGFVIADEIVMPQYINEYVNMAVGITPLCSLVLHNVKMVNERLNLEAIIQHNQKLDSVGSLANGIAHEINNPINGVMNYAQLIYDRIGKEDELSIYAAEIINETERVTKIVRNLLDYSHKDNRKQTPVSVNEIISDTLSLMTNILVKEYIILKVDPPEDLPMVLCNKQHIQQVLINLMTNSRDALNHRYPSYDDNKWLMISVNAISKNQQKFIEIVVEDSGSGIKDEIKDRVFDPFFTTKSRASHAGLGLFISRSLILENYGELFFYSEPGVTTKFFIYLPVAAD